MKEEFLSDFGRRRSREFTSKKPINTWIFLFVHRLLILGKVFNKGSSGKFKKKVDGECGPKYKDD